MNEYLTPSNIQIMIIYLVSGYISYTISIKRMGFSNDSQTIFKQTIGYLFWGTLNVLFCRFVLFLSTSAGILCKDIVEPPISLLFIIAIATGFIGEKINTKRQDGVILKNWDKPVATAWDNIFIYKNQPIYVHIITKSQKDIWGVYHYEQGHRCCISTSSTPTADMTIQRFKIKGNNAIPIDEFIWIPKSEIEIIYISENCPTNKKQHM